MAIAFLGVSEANNTDNSATALNITIPSEAVAGALLVMTAACQSEDAPLSAPAGWTLLDSVSLSGAVGAAPTVYVYYRTATSSGAGSAGSTVSLTPTASGRKRAIITAYSGASGLGDHQPAVAGAGIAHRESGLPPVPPVRRAELDGRRPRRLVIGVGAHVHRAQRAEGVRNAQSHADDLAEDRGLRGDVERGSVVVRDRSGHGGAFR